MSLEDKISEGIKEAMKSKEVIRRDMLRIVKKYIIEAKSAGPALDSLPDADVLKIIIKLAKQGTDSAEIFNAQGRADLAEYEIAQVAVLKGYLPVQLSDEELTVAIQAVIDRVGATSMKEMGKVMGIASKELSGKCDGKLVSEKVKALLA